jgi:nucleotidyltransferase substrate binding protein (TIGR01987 family)
MENSKEIRWKQRFQELSKSFAQLEKALEMENPDEIYRAGIIQFFEMTLELSWKTLKDYLESQEVIVNTPRETIQMAFQKEILENGHTWIDALQKRNLMAHAYDETRAKEAEELIRNMYAREIRQLIMYLTAKQ